MSEGHTDRLDAALGGKYRIERKLGEGGMAAVYLAEDLKHERKVALKILRPELAAVIGAERFLSEIKTTANLQHPHILPLFDSGEAGGYLYYVMPYIDGETLRDKLDREKQLGVEESVRIARDVADALDYAHRHGVIHRDIKPANILIHDGRPVVADFGIALAVTAAGGGRMTETGLSLGTPHYMSPEQASADRDLSARSDIYSLGCVLYEMIAGQPPHTGPSAQSILVHILTKEVTPLTELRHTVPGNVAAAVAKAIEKLPADRFETAKAFRDALEATGFTYEARPRAATTSALAVGGATPRGPWLRDRRSGAALAVAAAATAAAVFAWLRPTPAAMDDAPPIRSAVAGFEFASTANMFSSISADGRQIAAKRPGDAGGPLYLRRTDELDFTPIPGTENGCCPTFSPDGAWLAFGREGRIWRVETAGGPVLPVATGSYPRWGTPDRIVFQSADERLYSVAPTGGEPIPLIADESVQGNFPFLLPGGGAVVFRGFPHEGGIGPLAVVDVSTGTVKDLGIQGGSAQYVASGHLVYGIPEQALMAVPFDLRRLEVTGEPFIVLPDVYVLEGNARFAVSDNGVALYGLSPTGRAGVELVEVGLDGTRTPTRLGPGSYRHPRYSPDGRRIAYEREGRVWVFDRETGETEDFSDGAGAYPVWSADGRYIYYVESQEVPGASMTRRLVDGTAPAEVVYTPPSGSYAYPSSASPAGDAFVLGEWSGSARGMNLAILSMVGDSAVVRSYLRAEYHELSGAISPDGRWVAYFSTEDGGATVYVRSFADATGQVSVSGTGRDGVDPVWSPDGSAIYYVVASGPATPIQLVMRVPVTLGESLSAGTPETLFDGPFARSEATFGGSDWDIHPDGQRFIMLTGGEDTATGATSVGLDMRLVVNWFSELRAIEGR